MNTTDEIIDLLRLQLVKLFHSSLSFVSMHVHIPGGAKKRLNGTICFYGSELNSHTGCKTI